MKMTMKVVGLLAITLAWSAASAATTRLVPAGNVGAMRIEVPDAWREAQAAGRSAGTVAFASGAAGRLMVLLTPLATRMSDADVRDFVKRNAARVRPGSVEKSLQAEALRGPEAAGHYFTATDPAPKQDEYRFMRQGAVAVGAATMVFTVLWNDGAEADVREAMAAIAAIRFEKAAAG